MNKTTARRVGPWIIIAAAALLYPISVLAGGSPRFPDRNECVRPATAGSAIDAVFGRYSSVSAAEAKLTRVLKLGFRGAEVEPDGCGLFKVVVHGVPNLQVGSDLIKEARAVGLVVHLERGSP